MHTDDDVVVLFHVVKVFCGRRLVADAETWTGEKRRVGFTRDDAGVGHARVSRWRIPLSRDAGVRYLGKA